MAQPLLGLVLEVAGHLPEGEDCEAADREQGAKKEKHEDAARDDAAHEGKGRFHAGFRSVFGAHVVTAIANAPRSEFPL
jgi:hypothetical protein